MKNTYEIPEGCNKVTIEQIGNKIVTEFETSNVGIDNLVKGNIYHVVVNGLDAMTFIHKSKGHHFALLDTDGKLWKEDDRIGLYYGDYITIATKSEKQLLFDTLTKSGKQWSAETLQIEDLKVEPKVGDCVKLSYSGGAKVYAKIKSSNDDMIFADFWYSTTKGINTVGTFTSYNSIQILTPSQFQSEVNALGFEYDFKNDTFKELRWEPKLNSQYYFFDSLLDSPLITTNTNCDRDKDRIELGNCFKTKSECESAIEKIKNVLKSK